jgi:hypothetical protein
MGFGHKDTSGNPGSARCILPTLYIYTLSYSREHIIFKGGTSLSKAWDLIKRFSEDIDLVIDRRFLDFPDDLSRTQITKLREKSCQFISTTFRRDIEKALHGFGIDPTTFKITTEEITVHDKDPLDLDLKYIPITEELIYLPPRVIIQTGARSLFEPFVSRDVRSIIGQTFPDFPFSDPFFSVPTVLPKRTFLEKAFLLHEEFSKKEGQIIRVERMSRHLYDLERMMDTSHGKEAIEDIVLYKSIIEHREKFNRLKGIDYSTHNPNKINFVPPEEVLPAWSKDYSAMKENMIYDETPLDFNTLIKRIKELNLRFRGIQYQ